MARILLVDDGQDYLQVIVRSLNIQRHHVVLADRGTAVAEIGRVSSELFDVVVLDISKDTEADWLLLSHFRVVTTMNQFPTEIVAFSCINRGPQMRLRAARLGAHFVFTSLE